jgi:hypothetical protein
MTAKSDDNNALTVFFHFISLKSTLSERSTSQHIYLENYQLSKVEWIQVVKCKKTLMEMLIFKKSNLNYLYFVLQFRMDNILYLIQPMTLEVLLLGSTYQNFAKCALISLVKPLCKIQILPFTLCRLN